MPNAENFVLPSVAPEYVHALLASSSWGADSGALAIETVKAQLENDQRRPPARHEDVKSRVPSLFDIAGQKFAQSMRENDDILFSEVTKNLPPHVRSSAALMVDSVPYHMFCKAKQSAEGDLWETDEWILRNELRLRKDATSDQQGVTPSKRLRVDVQFSDTYAWSRGLVALSEHGDIVFAASSLTNASRTITRPKSLLGFKVLDEKRPPSIRIQPSVHHFAETFEKMTNGLLKGIQWDNIFIAGGIVLGTLLCTDDSEETNAPEQWKNSDIDLYICDLGPIQANEKIEHIFSVFKQNLPPDAPVLVVRNSKTITFFSHFPLRRIQVVLKLVDSPKAVLLNFDLDICAIGWDGREVWMLPRAARALETGYTVFTMDLINGHYLGDRRATQEDRVFKYAHRGFGIRILPSYLTEFQRIVHDTEEWEALEKGRGFWAPSDLGGVWGPQDFQQLVDNARAWTTEKIPAPEDGAPVELTHRSLQEKYQISEDPQRRGALSGLSLFIRHVALWEHEVAGDIVIERSSWASQLYDNRYADAFGVSYNDTPEYLWDENFNAEGFVSKMDQFNNQEAEGVDKGFVEYLETGSQNWYHLNGRERQDLLRQFLRPGFQVQRISYSTSIQEILGPKGDIYLPVWLPQNFVDFANERVPEAVRKSGMQSYNIPVVELALTDDAPAHRGGSEGVKLALWRITSTTMWQQLNRTIDEIHEALWSFHLANAAHSLDGEDRLQILISQFSRRAIRLTTEDEYAAFARWAMKRPLRLDYQREAGPLNHVLYPVP